VINKPAAALHEYWRSFLAAHDVLFLEKLQFRYVNSNLFCCILTVANRWIDYDFNIVSVVPQPASPTGREDAMDAAVAGFHERTVWMPKQLERIKQTGPRRKQNLMRATMR